MKNKFYTFVYIFVLPTVIAISLNEWRNTLDWLLWVALAVLGAFILFNIIAILILNGRKIESRTIRTKLLEQKDLLVAKYNKYRFRVILSSILSTLYLVILLIVIPAINIGLFWKCIDLYKENTLLAVFISVLSLILFIYESFVFSRAFQPIRFNPGPYIYLNSDNAPKIWTLCESAMRRFGIRKPFALLAVPGNNARITQYKKYLEVAVGYELLTLLKPAELYAVFLHEFAHVLKKDAAYCSRVSRRNARWQFLSMRHKLFPNFLFIPIGVLTVNLHQMFMLITSYNIEMKVDAMLKGGVEAHNLVNALAKMDLLTYHQYRLPIENLAYNISTQTNYIDCLHQKFTESYKTNQEKWEHIIKTQLPARLDTHPNLAERMENLNINQFTLDFSITDADYLSEIKSIQKNIVDAVKNSETQSCEFKYGYSVYKAHLSEYKNDAENFSDSLLEIANSYFCLCDYENAMVFYDRVLRNNPKNPNALFHKGLILCNNYDNCGMQYFLELLDNLNYFTRAYMSLTAYIQYQGLKDEKDRLRQHIYDKTDLYYDAVIANKSKYLNHTFSSERLQKLKAFIESHPNCGYALLMRKTYKDIDYHYLLLSVNTNVIEKQTWFMRYIEIQLSEEYPELIIQLIPHVSLPKSYLKSVCVLKSAIQHINDRD